MSTFKTVEEYFDFRIDPFTDFNVYFREIGGELVGRYRFKNNFITKDKELIDISNNSDHLVEQTREWAVYSEYFGQKSTYIVPTKIGILPTLDFLNNNFVTDGINNAMVIRFKHIYNSNINKTSIAYGDSTIINDTKHEVLCGEFFLPINTIKSIKRINIKSELLQGLKNLTGFNFTTLTELNSMPFLKFYIGYGNVNEDSTPPTYNSIEYPTVCSRLRMENRIKWNTLSGDCMAWREIHDGTNLNLEIEKNQNPNRIIINIKVEVDINEFKLFLDNNFDYTAYIEGAESYDIIIYPPSVYLYPIDSVSNLVFPRKNTISRWIDKIVFEVPRRLKTDGNIQFKIDFFEVGNPPFYSSSSYYKDDSFEWNRWFYSTDNQATWKSVPSLEPTFDNIFYANGGVDAPFSTHVKYVFTKELFELIRKKSNVKFIIHQLDGTLTNRIT